MRKMHGLFVGLILNLWLGVSLVTAQSGYPQPTNTYVNDFARLLTPTDTTLITQLLTDLKAKNDIEATIVTLNSVHDYPTGDETIETFATHLFNTWGIGDKANHKGILILVSTQDRKVRIELGTGYESQYNDEMQQVINEQILPAFKQGDYSRGLYQGTRGVIAALTGIWPPDERPVQSSSGNSVPVTGVSSRRQSDGRMGIFLFGAFVVIVGYLILAYIFGWPVGNSRSDNDDRRHSWSSRSSSSRSSSFSDKSPFGGGRSSGGGASGSW
ncbi:MAG: TPM domain-containing protein [Anaerolineae bacterium]|nr:TPM domain-containing protein [Anaerolineae bacterium]